MGTQVVFMADPRLKSLTLEKLRQEGITLKTLLNFCMKEYVQGKFRFGLEYCEPEVEIIPINKELQKKMDRIAQLLS